MIRKSNERHFWPSDIFSIMPYNQRDTEAILSV